MEKKTISEEELISEFNTELQKHVNHVVKEGYTPKLLIRMIAEYTGYIAAKKVIQSNNTDGYMKLHYLDLLKYSVEALVIEPKYAPLFSEKEIKMCRRRLP